MIINKKFVIKALIYALLVIIIAVLQTNMLNSAKILNVKPNLIISLVVAACILENEKYGAILGFICGFCFDIGFASPFLMSGIFYFAAAYTVGTFTRIYFKKNLFTMIIAVLPVCFIKEVINMFYLIATWDKFNFINASLHYIIPEFIYTVVLAAPVYFVVKFTAARISYYSGII